MNQSLLHPSPPPLNHAPPIVYMSSILGALIFGDRNLTLEAASDDRLKLVFTNKLPL